MKRTRGASAQVQGNGALREQAAEPLRRLPSVDRLIGQPALHGLRSRLSHTALVLAARNVLAQARQDLRLGAAPPDLDELTQRTLALALEQARPPLRPVINATGVMLNTNLGRAPLSAAALAAMAEVAAGYSNLEFTLESGERGSRHQHARELLCELTGAADALVVNNNAAAILVVLSTLAAGREVVVSRGELVEIGGGFRVPDVMRQGGARLVEVGTTNRTRIDDYAAAIGAETGAMLIVHPSNFKIVGFTTSPTRAELARLARQHQLPLVEDLGSGCLLATERWGLAHEPTPVESLAAGVDVVCFSGDKLLGGPQAGIILGRADLLARIARHPLMRAVRIDKLTLAALVATLQAYRHGTAEHEVPIWRMIATPLAELETRASAWVERLRAHGVRALVVAGESTIGGGSLPGALMPTALCAVELNADHEEIEEIAELAARLRQGSPAIVGRVARARLLLDPRTVDPTQDDVLVAAVAAAYKA